MLASVIEGRLLAHQRLHAAHPRRELRVLDVQFDIGGKLARLAVWAQVVGTQHFHPAHDGQNRLGAQLPVMSLMAAGTRDGPLVGGRDRKLQEFGSGRPLRPDARPSAPPSRPLPDRDGRSGRER